MVWKSRAASGSQGSKLSVITSSQELHGLCEVPSFNTFTLTTWLLLKQAQRNLREGVGRLGLRVKFNQAISNIPKHRLTFSSLFVLRIVVRLRQRRLSLELGAQANLQDCINQSQEKCQPFTSRRNTTSSPGLESRQRAGFRIILPPSGC